MLYSQIPPVTCVLIVLNIIGYVIELRRGQNVLIQQYGMHQGALQTRNGLTEMVISTFLHVNLFHLASNMICLYSFGLTLENRIGPIFYLLIYIAGILGAGLLINSRGGNGRHVGASGAVWALMCATLIFNLVHHYDPLYALQGIALNLVYSFTRRVSWQGHIGGGIAGLVAALVMHFAGLI